MSERIRIMKDEYGHTYFILHGKERAFVQYVLAMEDGDEEFDGEEFEDIGRALSNYTFADPREET